MNKLPIMIFLLCLPLITIRTPAQEAPAPPEAITTETLTRLQSVQQIDFAELDAEFDTGWFALDASGERLAFSDRTGGLVLLVDGQVFYVGHPGAEDESYPGSLVDVVFLGDEALPVHILEGQTYFDFEPMAFEQPVGAWVNADTERIYAETAAFADAGAQIVAITATDDEAGYEIADILPYAPGADESGVVRVGRIPRPYAVTSSLEGIVKLWNLETGEALYEVDNGTGQPSVFGAINLPPTHLVWRDNANESLYLLDFETGQNRFIDDLDGEYAQWYFLSNDASTILAVNLGFEPVVVAWDVATGERTILGEYRECSRPQPDMARLSDDGTTLVIGCDTGLDVWRIAPDS